MIEFDQRESEGNTINQLLTSELKRLGLKIVSNRIKSRRPVEPVLREEGIISSYDFNEQQDPSSGLFPLELKACQEIWDASSYLNETRQLLLPAMAYSIYGHQEQWRNSGQPFFRHIADVAKEAAENKFPWWGVAAGFVHDLHEDSRKHGHQVRPEQIRRSYRKLGYPREGEVIYRTMHAMTKFGKEPAADRFREKAKDIFFRKRPIPGDIRTVMRLYDTLLELEGTDWGDEVVIPLKLIDNKSNFDGYLERKKRQSRARKSLRIYVPMAEAFHLHKLRDELALLALGELYPETVERLKETQRNLQLIYQSLVNDHMEEYISEQFIEFSPKITFSVPSIYDLYKVESKEENPLPHLNLQILLPELPGESEETDEHWNARAINCYLALIPFADSLPRQLNLPEIIRETEVIPGKYLHFTFTNNGVNFRTTFLSVRQRIADHASLLDLFTYRNEPDIGQMEEWQEMAIDNLRNVRERYAEARKQGNMAAFFQSIADEKRIFDEKGNPQQFPPQASALEVISVLYGEDAFFVKSVKVKDLSGQIRTVQGESLFQVLHEGEQIIELTKEKKETIQPYWLDHTVIEEIKEMYIQKLLELCERDINRKKLAMERGDEVLQNKLFKAWSAYIGYSPGTDSGDMNLRIPLRYVQSAFANYSSDEMEFIYKSGLDQVNESTIESVVRALVEFRKGVRFLEVQMPDTEGSAERFLDILRREGINLLRAVGQIIPGPGGEGKAWFHENELGKTVGERRKKFKTIERKLEESDFNVLNSA